MASQRDPARVKRSSPPIVPIQQEFLFVDAAKAKSSKQGRRNARSFVMQKARRERPWSTSKHAAKQRKSPESTSPTTIGTPDLSTTPKSTPSPPIVYPGTDYFPLVDSNNLLVVKPEICPECQILLCRPGQHLCPRCLLLQPPQVPMEDPDTGLFDPFGTMSVDMNGEVSVLLEHCKCTLIL
jgi:hypothetical protein